MSVTEASAPGKIILFGEHAVVYGEPAIAAPVSQVRAWARVSDADGEGVYISAPDLREEHWLEESSHDDALAAAVRLVQVAAGLEKLPSLRIEVRSDIPIASGLGSGAATAAALIRALAHHLHLPDVASNSRVADLTYEVEKIHHGTPSGIDNTVVALEQAIYFVRRRPSNLIEPFSVAQPVTLLVADSGVRSSTRQVVGDVRRRWQAQRRYFEELFASCGRIADAARSALQDGRLEDVGRLMNENQTVLEAMTVSGPELERLIAAARTAGAAGAKLSGAGRGGNMIALVDEDSLEAVEEVLLRGGARRVMLTTIGMTELL